VRRTTSKLRSVLFRVDRVQRRTARELLESVQQLLRHRCVVTVTFLRKRRHGRQQRPNTSTRWAGLRLHNISLTPRTPSTGSTRATRGEQGRLSRRLPDRAPRRPNDPHRHARKRPGEHQRSPDEREFAQIHQYDQRIHGMPRCGGTLAMTASILAINSRDSAMAFSVAALVSANSARPRRTKSAHSRRLSRASRIVSCACEK
jgi:hypothetical protein